MYIVAFSNNESSHADKLYYNFDLCISDVVHEYKRQ